MTWLHMLHFLTIRNCCNTAKVMPLAANKEQKLMVVDRLGDLKTFPALLYVANFLDDKDLQSRRLLHLRY